MTQSGLLLLAGCPELHFLNVVAQAGYSHTNWFATAKSFKPIHTADPPALVVIKLFVVSLSTHGILAPRLKQCRRHSSQVIVEVGKKRHRSW